MKIKHAFPLNVNPVVAFGVHDSNLRLLERILKVKIFPEENEVIIEGEEENVSKADQLLHTIYQKVQENQSVSHDEIKVLLEGMEKYSDYESSAIRTEGVVISKRGGRLKPRSLHQAHYIGEMLLYDLVFSIGPAGTGKTYLAVGAALHLLLIGRVKKIILTRPVVEAGENLGFLPGTLEEKIDPYLRPLFDAVSEMLSPEELKYLLENQIIELAPLAYMRGRTLSNAFIILDEAQNTTTTQMKLFLTRLGENSKMVVTGDVSQTDLPYGKESGLKQAVEFFQDLEGIRFVYFEKKDALRHGLVKRVLEVYEKREEEAWKGIEAR
jgi:phosphate starvation-inducible PhoH-like protein